MAKDPRYHYKNLRVVLLLYSANYYHAGAIVVQFRTPKGNWGVIDKIGYYNLDQADPKVFFNSEKLGFWLNQGAIIGRRANRLLADFCSAQVLRLERRQEAKAQGKPLLSKGRAKVFFRHDSAIFAHLMDQLSGEKATAVANEWLFDDSNVLEKLKNLYLYFVDELGLRLEQQYFSDWPEGFNPLSLFASRGGLVPTTKTRMLRKPPATEAGLKKKKF